MGDASRISLTRLKETLSRMNHSMFNYVKTKSEPSPVVALDMVFCVDIETLKSVIGKISLNHVLRRRNSASIPMYKSTNSLRFGIPPSNHISQ